MKILVIAPHMDDEVLGCGGTIVRHTDKGDEVSVCVVANRAYHHEYDPARIAEEKEDCRGAQRVLGYRELLFLDMPDERLDACQVDLIVPIEKVVNRLRPEVVYLPHRGDLNQDHRAVFEAVRVACRPYAAHRVGTLRAFEVPSSSDQVPSISEWPFCPTVYVNIAEVLDRKIQAMTCYRSETRAFPNPRSAEGLAIHAKKRGMEVGMNAAEAFMLLRETWC